MSDRRSFLIQIDHLGARPVIGDLVALLKGTSVVLDQRYGPHLLDRKLGRYVVLGEASERGRRLAERRGFRFFANPGIGVL